MIVSFYKLEKHIERLNIIQMGSMLMQNEFSNTSSAQKLDGGKRKIKRTLKDADLWSRKIVYVPSTLGEVTLLALFVFHGAGLQSSYHQTPNSATCFYYHFLLPTLYLVQELNFKNRVNQGVFNYPLF